MSSTTSRLPPLELPELVAAILQYITDPQDLRDCILVNKLWASEATTFLWEKDPPIKAFVDLPAFKERDRLQIYAKKVRKLTLTADDARYNHLFVDIQFPRLETIVLDSSAYNVEENLLQFLQPSLRNFHIYGGPIGDTLLREIQTRSPHLEELLIDHPRNNLTAEGLLAFLTKMPSLKGLLFMYGMYRAISEEVICHLAKRTSLVRLDFEQLIRQELAQSLVNSIAHPFEHLEILTCKAEGKAFALLTPHLLRLQTLRLSLPENMDSILSGIAQCPNISHVDVKYPIHTVPPTSEIIHLAEKHRNLNTLHLHWQDDDDIIDENQPDPNSLDDANIENIASLLGCITTLTLWFPLSADHTTKSLISIGKHCKLLKYLKIPGVFDMVELLAEDNCLFPNLLELTVRKESFHANGRSMLAPAVHRHAPLLEDFEAVEDDDFTDMVMGYLSNPDAVYVRL
ncbi:MAG: hypothetical protein M1812_004021 [Candelaria pacifica]|nr:MAG: hypothetical protein M1812_004021 [Candelaria pacifica]